MKQIIFLALFFSASLGVVSSAPIPFKISKLETVVVAGATIYVTPNVYMNAQYVKVELLDKNNAVLATSTIAPGTTTTFALSANAAKIKETFHISETQEYIIMEETHP